MKGEIQAIRVILQHSIIRPVNALPREQFRGNSKCALSAKCALQIDLQSSAAVQVVGYLQVTLNNLLVFELVLFVFT